MSACGQRRFRVVLAAVIALTLCTSFSACALWETGGDAVPTETARGRGLWSPQDVLRIFWVNSYSAEDRWALQLRIGILEALARSGYSVARGNVVMSAYELRAAEVDPEGWGDEMAARAEEAVEAARAFAPNIVILSEDEAVQLVLPRYTDPGVRFVFCGATELPEGEAWQRDDVIGVTRRVNAVETVAMARALTGSEGRYLVIGDATMSSRAVTKVAYDALVEKEPGALVPFWAVAGSWEGWQSAILERLGEIDFVVVASYRSLLDAQGQAVSGPEMMGWMFANVPVPVFSLSNAVVADGGVGGLVADGYKEGQFAGQITARLAQADASAAGQGVADLVSPIMSSATSYSRLVLNAAAARHWGLRIPVLFPIAAEVYQTMPAMSSNDVLNPDGLVSLGDVTSPDDAVSSNDAVSLDDVVQGGDL